MRHRVDGIVHLGAIQGHREDVPKGLDADRHAWVTGSSLKALFPGGRWLNSRRSAGRWDVDRTSRGSRLRSVAVGCRPAAPSTNSLEQRSFVAAPRDGTRPPIPDAEWVRRCSIVPTPVSRGGPRANRAAEQAGDRSCFDRSPLAPVRHLSMPPFLPLARTRRCGSMPVRRDPHPRGEITQRPPVSRVRLLPLPVREKALPNAGPHAVDDPRASSARTIRLT